MKLTSKALWLAGALQSCSMLAFAQLAPTITEYPTLSGGSEPYQIVTGPDGALWFTEFSANKIGRITTAGVVTEFTVPTASSGPWGITNGPDGAVWFTEQAGIANKIGRITTAGVITEFTVTTAASHPYLITAGPDGALWFTEFSGNKIGRITTAGVVTNEYPIPSVSSGPIGITAGPDGALWFDESDTSKIGRITTAGVITEFPVAPSASPYAITSGPDGAVWFTDTFGEKIWRMSTTGTTTSYPTPTSGSSPQGIVTGSDGALWFTEAFVGKIGRVTTSGTFNEYATPTSGSGARGITAGPDGSIWFAEMSVSQIGRAALVPFQFYPVTPCRIADTRISQSFTGAFGPPSLAAYTNRTFPILSSACSIPSTAQAYSLNLTVVPSGPLGFLSVWPAGDAYPGVSTLNSSEGNVIANAAVVPAGTSGGITVVAGNPTDLIIDINGYFAPAAASGLDFYPLTPCRIADTRSTQSFTGAFGPPSLTAYGTRDFPIATSPCLSGSEYAYSLNITAVPDGPLGFLSIWPAGDSYPGVSTLNSPNGSVIANAAIVPAGTNGDIDLVAGNQTDVVIDINGKFAAPASGGLQFYAVTPCRIADTRSSQSFTGAFGPPSLTAYTDRNFPIQSSLCGIPANAQAYSLNFTVVPAGPLGFLSVSPAGEAYPGVSTLNSSDGSVIANAAIVPAGTGGNITVVAGNPTDLIIDVNGYFAAPQ